MKSQDLAKLLEQKGLTPEKALEIIEKYEERKEKVRKYQKERYFKVSIAIPKTEVQKLISQFELNETTAKQFLAYLKLKERVGYLENSIQYPKEEIE